MNSRAGDIFNEYGGPIKADSLKNRFEIMMRWAQSQVSPTGGGTTDDDEVHWVQGETYVENPVADAIRSLYIAFNRWVQWRSTSAEKKQQKEKDGEDIRKAAVAGRASPKPMRRAAGDESPSSEPGVIDLTGINTYMQAAARNLGQNAETTQKQLENQRLQIEAQREMAAMSSQAVNTLKDLTTSTQQFQKDMMAQSQSFMVKMLEGNQQFLQNFMNTQNK